MAESFDTIQQKKIVVAMSGGVDSSVAAALLQRRGAQVEGVFMALAQPDLAEQLQRVRQVADFLKIPLTVVDLAEPFQRLVVDYFSASYFAGKTPNPCVVCNRTIKCGRLLEQVRKNLGAELLATGHYARINGDVTTGYRLLQGVDPQKDQSYFLGLLSQEQLGQLCFPLGGYRKGEVYTLAAEFGLAFGQTPESQDICFLKEQSVAAFLASHSPGQGRPGPMLTLQGEEIGHHAGIHHYTVGQRRGLGLPDATPWYVVELDPARNAVVVGKDADLWQQEVLLSSAHWLSGQAPPLPCVCMVKIRSRHPASQAEISQHDGGGLVKFSQPQRAVTPGQFAVFYQGEVVLGCGEIAK
ncbi:tRNA 2-thiouridine(34) synthase MnmA [Thiovibrio frasassiensis]|uniref:tRNA-specific 2-thiouridylase MnmA n=1 Tax=Thiovibrio frasassiensis TaxID=2984131 RepID=A0A9X4RLG3_9BACT|nr:tRNA 2-thiouridine(34) synthase MnmA [Thiovibrio frasassiensis]MDG4475689.1 tRNA 2-thiouridine(34) synthase MnmA [Thiovibrio frasassiensis]